MMKKIGALSFAAFYLMLTTGMFVCMLHCSGQSLFVPEKTHCSAAKKETGLYKKSAADHKSCGASKAADCCDGHGEYVIKENIKRTIADELKVPAMLLAVSLSSFPDLLVPDLLTGREKWNPDTGHPPDRKTPLYLSNRVLLI